jgi:adenosylcobinamide-GDP ribazoletransferase
LRAADGRLRTEARAAGAGLAFLTRVPVGRRLDAGPRDLARAAPAFPLVGAALGAVVGAAAAAGAEPLGPALAATLAVALGALLTGAIHLDALADSADALGAGTPARALEIMRDPRVGAFGTVAILLVLLTEASALAQLGPAGAIELVAVAFGLARATAPAVACAVPDARRGTGLGRPLAEAAAARAALGAVLAAGGAVALAGPKGLALVGCALVCAVAAAVLCRRRFGGVTGDALGALIMVTEAACLCVAVALVR